MSLTDNISILWILMVVLNRLAIALLHLVLVLQFECQWKITLYFDYDYKPRSTINKAHALQ